MGTALRGMTSAEFLAWEERQEERWEFDGVAPVAMAGATVRHAAILVNLLTALNTRLRGTRCRALGPEVKVETSDGKYRYPDAFVTCTPVPGTATVALAPVVIFEISSPTTAHIDRTEKLPEYRELPSVRRYVMIEQDAVALTYVERRSDHWAMDVKRGEEVLALPELGIELPLSELYADVDLPADGELATAR